VKTFRGRYGDGRTARLTEVRVEVLDGRLRFRVGATEHEIPVEALTLEAPLGSLPLVARLPEGARLELEPGREAWTTLHPRRRSGFVDWLETHWVRTAIVALAGIAATALLLTRGLPVLAEPVAALLPERAGQLLGRQTLEVLDARFLGPSELDAARRAGLTAAFEPLRRAAGVGAELRFRSGGRFGPNALALPDGTIVVTDALVQLAGDEREVLAVLAHELGHVHGRHGLRAILQNSGAALVLAAVFGDLVSLTSSAVVLPTVLLQSGYSRELEREADAFALALLEETDLDPAWFARILGRLQALGEAGPSLLSTHPHAAERRTAALRAARDPALGDPDRGVEAYGNDGLQP
jgi:hypothetical protein